MFWLILIIIAGFFFWLANLKFLIFSRDWPLLLVLCGIIVLINTVKRNRRRSVIGDLEKGKISAAEAERRLLGQK